MRKYSWIFAIFLGIGVGTAEAQSDSTPRPRWEASASAGLIEARPDDNDLRYHDNWYADGRYAGAISYYWTRHLKTEFEYAVTGEGSRFVEDHVNLAGTVYPTYFEEFHRLQQASLRMVWQFRDNEWVHPYVSAGVVLDAERTRHHAPAQYQTPIRGNPPVLVRQPLDVRDDLRRGGVTVGGGAKFYMSKNAFFNAGAIGTYAKPAATVSLIAGFGIEF
jgi:opacity protein-like surface antigen